MVSARETVRRAGLMSWGDGTGAEWGEATMEGEGREGREAGERLFQAMGVGLGCGRQ